MLTKTQKLRAFFVYVEKYQVSCEELLEAASTELNVLTIPWHKMKEVGVHLSN